MTRNPRVGPGVLEAWRGVVAVFLQFFSFFFFRAGKKKIKKKKAWGSPHQGERGERFLALSGRYCRYLGPGKPGTESFVWLPEKPKKN